MQGRAPGGAGLVPVCTALLPGAAQLPPGPFACLGVQPPLSETRTSGGTVCLTSHPHVSLWPGHALCPPLPPASPQRGTYTLRASPCSQKVRPGPLRRWAQGRLHLHTQRRPKASACPLSQQPQHGDEFRQKVVEAGGAGEPGGRDPSVSFLCFPAHTFWGNDLPPGLEADT